MTDITGLPIIMPEYASDSSIFINNVLLKLGLNDISSYNEESTEFEKIFMAILDFVGSIEFYTTFSKRTYLQCEEFLFSHPEITSIIMQANMLLQGYIEIKPQYGASILALFKGFSKAIFNDDIKDENGKTFNVKKESDITAKFYEQISENPDFAVYRSYSTWHKVFILLQYHYVDIAAHIRSIKFGEQRESK